MVNLTRIYIFWKIKKKNLIYAIPRKDNKYRLTDIIALVCFVKFSENSARFYITKHKTIGIKIRYKQYAKIG